MSLSRYKEALYKPLIDENPITLQILGICSALAVTNNLTVTLVMCGVWRIGYVCQQSSW